MHRGTDRVETRPERHTECVLEAASGPHSTSAPTFLPDPAASAGSAECCERGELSIFSSVGLLSEVWNRVLTA